MIDKQVKTAAEAVAGVRDGSTVLVGEPRILKACTYPLTAAARVKRIYTNLAVVDVTPQGLLVQEMIAGMTLDKLQALTEPRLLLAPIGRCWRRPTPPRPGPRRHFPELRRSIPGYEAAPQG